MLHAYEGSREKKKRSREERVEVEDYVEDDADFFTNFTEKLEKAEKTGALDLTEAELTYKQVRDGLVPFLKQTPEVTSVSIANHFGINKRLGDRVAILLAEVESLRELVIFGHEIGDDGAIALANHKGLKVLNICSNNVTKKGLKALAASKSLVELDISGNDVDDRGVKILAKSKLKALRISGGNIGNKGAMALGLSQTLVTLDISGNKIEDEGIVNLATNKVIKALNVNNNRLSSVGILALAGNGNLFVLVIYRYEFSEEVNKFLNEKPSVRRLNVAKIGHMDEKDYNEWAAPEYPKPGKQTSVLYSFNKYGAKLAGYAQETWVPKDSSIYQASSFRNVRR